MRFVVLGALLAAGVLGAQEPTGYLGIVFTCPLKRIEDASGVRVIHLAYPAVESVEPASPASIAGISSGDTILAYDSVDVLNHEISLTRMLRPGRRVLIRVRRNGAVKEVAARVIARPAAYVESIRVMPPPQFFGPLLTAPGAAFVRANDDLMAALGVPKGSSGVLVVNVLQGTPAEASGLHAGDVVLSADGHNVTDPAALAQMMALPPTDAVTLRVYGNHKIRTVTLRPQ
ncbi:MAG TPA: PDZ domain-containing protein [Gemmatimonadaceae bacterium]|nr:PDZ domain-containing protein [Gemmatimonadaceae bacterium]